MAQNQTAQEPQNPAPTAPTAPYLWRTYRDDDPPAGSEGRLYILCHVEGEGARRLDSEVTEADILPLLPQDGQEHNVRVDYREEGRKGSLAQIRLVLTAPAGEGASSARSSSPTAVAAVATGQTPSAVEMLRIYTQGLDRAYGYAAEAQREALSRAERAQANAAEAQLRFADAALTSQLSAAKESEQARREILRQEAESARDARERERAHAEKVLGLQLAQTGAAQPAPSLLEAGMDLFEKAAPFLGMGLELVGGFEGLKEKATGAIKKVGAVSENSPINRLLDLAEAGLGLVADRVMGPEDDDHSEEQERGQIIDAEAVQTAP